MAAATAASCSRAELGDALGREREQIVQVGTGQRCALGGRLDLDEAAVPGHDHVRVDLCGGVLAVVEVEQGTPSTIPHETAATVPVSGDRSKAPS